MKVKCKMIIILLLLNLAEITAGGKDECEICEWKNYEECFEVCPTNFFKYATTDDMTEILGIEEETSKKIYFAIKNGAELNKISDLAKIISDEQYIKIIENLKNIDEQKYNYMKNKTIQNKDEANVLFFRNYSENEIAAYFDVSADIIRDVKDILMKNTEIKVISEIAQEMPPAEYKALSAEIGKKQNEIFYNSRISDQMLMSVSE